MKSNLNSASSHNGAAPKMAWFKRLMILLSVNVLSAAVAMAEPAALYSGRQLSSESLPKLNIPEQELAAAGYQADLALSMVMHKLGIDPGSSEYNEITGAVDEFLDYYDDFKKNNKTKLSETSFVVMYMSCAMLMTTPYQDMAIRLPPDTPRAYMEMVDHAEKKAYVIELNRALTDVSAHTGRGWNSGIELSARNEPREYIGYMTQAYDFKSSAGLGNMFGGSDSVEQAGNQGGLPGIASMVSTDTGGSMWVSDEVKGFDVTLSFYENFASQIEASQGGMSGIGGMISNMVGQLEHGLPLYSESKTKSKVFGMTKIVGESKNWIMSDHLVQRPISLCTDSIIPVDAGYQVQRIGGAGSETGGTSSASGGDSANPGEDSNGSESNNGTASPVNACDCSCEAFKKLQEQGDDMDKDVAGQCMMQCAGQYMSCAMNMGR